MYDVVYHVFDSRLNWCSDIYFVLLRLRDIVVIIRLIHGNYVTAINLVIPGV